VRGLSSWRYVCETKKRDRTLEGRAQAAALRGSSDLFGLNHYGTGTPLNKNCTGLAKIVGQL
jgi:hypothetical protein